MKLKVIYFISGLAIALALTFCNDAEKGKSNQTILRGQLTIYIDETLLPIVEDQVSVFESQYDAKIKIVSKPEAEVVNGLLNGSYDVVIIARDLSRVETQQFERRKIFPKRTQFGTDAIAVIGNRSNRDTLISTESIIKFMHGENVKGINGIVFDNPNSSTVRFMDSIAGGKSANIKGIYSYNNSREAIKYVAENSGFIGIVGLNWLSQPDPEDAEIMNKIKVLSVGGAGQQGYFSPSQNNLAEAKYPLARDLFIVDCSGKPGLGIGFASFIAGERGQRIVLKSGLLPIRMPGRKISIRNSIEKDKNN